MKRLFTICTALAASMLATHNGAAAPPDFTSGTLAAYFDEEPAEVPVAEEVVTDEHSAGGCDAVATDCGCGEDAACACGEEAAECGEDVGCGDGCGGCDLGDPWTLQGYLQPCCDKSTTYGGWFSMGYYNNNERLSIADADSLSFNDFPDHLNLDQAWLYVEKVAEAEGCCADYGYRFDIMYGVHGHAAQSYGNPESFEPVFGKNRGTWDASLDHGPYAWAMPQLYGEVAKGDWSVKIGHWFTPVGYEVIPDTGNFFYSHTLTHYNSEPFTHTGVLGTYNGFDKVTPIVGWALGWDTGFDVFEGGNIYVGGMTYKPNDDVSFTYMNTIGDLGWRSGGQFGFTQHIVGVANLTENTTWVIQSDYLHTDGTITDDDFENEDKGVTNYLIYKLNDCWSVGGRIEWWKSNNVIPGEDASFYDITGGINYHATANLVIRPEIRYDWTSSDEAFETAFGEDYNQEWFGINAVLTY
ncbi:MAG: porin [Planctomycetes bacterium]|nr:porin [Planctomycetota bacterium]